ncbi:MAG: low molecular weight phosphotyrosine protein phosphatase [Pseudomonadota bacterium]
MFDWLNSLFSSGAGRRVLIVCTANVCRSPAAEALIRFHLKRLGKSSLVSVESAGVSVANPGQQPDVRMRDIGGELGVTFKGIRSRSISTFDLSAFDVVWCMERAHLDEVSRLESQPGTLELFDPSDADIADPFYQSKAAVRDTFELLDTIARTRASQIVNET